MKVKLTDTDNGCVGAIEIPTSGVPGRVVVASLGDDKADALLKASVLAQRIASDPLVNALLPPNAMANIRAARALARAAQAGPAPLRRLWSRLRGPGKQRLAQALHKEAAQVETAACCGPSDCGVSGGSYIPSYWAGQEGPDDIEVGIAPLAIFAAKYGPDAARLVAKKLKQRKARKAAARRRAAAAARARERAKAETEPESDEPEADEPEADNGGGES